MRLTGLGALYAAGLLLAACASPQAEGSPAGSPPNIVFFLADDLGWNDVGYHGSAIKTPNIDRLAAAGTRLEQFYVQPVCSPTRASFLTGRYPIRYGLQVGVVRPWAQYGLPLREELLPECLQRSGYETAICGKWHLGHITREYLPTSRGFDHQYGHYNGAIEYYSHERNGGKDWNRDDQPLDEKGYTTELIGQEAVRLIEAHDPSKPLFLYVPFNAPHTPLEAPQRFIDLYADLPSERRQRFAAMVSCLDEVIGQVIASLENRGMDENTLILFASDNGGPRGRNGAGNNEPLRGGKGSFFEGGIRVPAIACWPGRLEAGAVIDEPMHIVDLFPTLLSLAGAGRKGSLPLDGMDMWPTITGRTPSPRDEMLINITPQAKAIRVGTWKLIQRRGRHLLFDLASDPGEQNNLAEEEPTKLEELRQRMAKYVSEAVEPKRAGSRPPAGFVVPARWGHGTSKK